MRDLTQELLMEGVDPEDLVDVVTDFYCFGHQSSLEHFDYSRGGGAPHAIRLAYEGTQLDKITTGPGWDERDAELLTARIRVELLDPPEVSIARRILFAGYPVNGYFETIPFFQILPAPPEAPKPPITALTTNSHPLILEFQTEKFGNRSASIRRISRSFFELTIFLNAVLECPVLSIASNGKTHWITALSEDGVSSNCTLGIESYQFKSFKSEDKHFSPIANLDPIQIVEENQYYGRPLELGRSLQVPENLARLTHNYRALNAPEKKRFLIAAFWLHQATTAASNSTSFLNSIYAIDALVPNETGGPPCSQCQRPQGKSEADKFVQFLEEVAPEESEDSIQVKTARRKLHRTRGQLAHGKDLLASFRDGGRFAFNPTGLGEMDSLWGAQYLAKRAVVNWLKNQTTTGSNLAPKNPDRL